MHTYARIGKFGMIKTVNLAQMYNTSSSNMTFVSYASVIALRSDKYYREKNENARESRAFQRN